MHGGGAAVITDKMMQEAAEELYQALLTSLPDENQCSYQFSERFERRMKRLIRRAEHPLRHRILQRVASITLVLFLGFVTLLAISPSVRAAVFGWVREQYENFVTYQYENDMQENVSHTEYELCNIPGDFELTRMCETESETMIYYANTSTEQIMLFCYSNISDASTYNIYLDEMLQDKAKVNNQEAVFYYSLDENQTNVLVWIDYSTDTLFTIAAFLDKEEIISIAESVQEIE